MMNSALNMMNPALNLMNSALKHDEFCIKDDESCIKDDEFCIKDDEFCIKDDEFCIKHDGFCIKDDGFCIKDDGFCIKDDEFRIQIAGVGSVSNAMSAVKKFNDDVTVLANDDKAQAVHAVVDSTEVPSHNVIYMPSVDRSYLLRGIYIRNKSHNLPLILGLNHAYIFPGAGTYDGSLVSFQWKNPDFLLKHPDFLFRDPDFLLKKC